MSSVYDYSAFEPTDDPIKDYVDDPSPQAAIATQPKQDLSAVLGKHMIYTYANGWQYELYFRNDHSCDYRIRSGTVGGRWTTRQAVHLADLGHGIYKIAWTEPPGSIACLNVSFEERWVQGWFGLAHWLTQNPSVGTVHQNAHLKNIREHRDNGPVFPYFIMMDFAEIHYVEDRGLDNDEVIACEVNELPEGYWDRKN